MLKPLLEKLIHRQDLSEVEAEGLMTEVMEGRAGASILAGLLTALVMKGERTSEIVGLARTMRARAVSVPVPTGEIFDTCGTGGDRSGTFNISSAAALVVASCGVRVAKHGNRSVSSACGSADVFEALGVNIMVSPEGAARMLRQAGIAFLFAPTFHPSMRHAGPTRRELGLRTAFNLLGPLTNPAGATRQLVGVPTPELTDVVAGALIALGSTRAWVVHGADGLDELSVTGYTKVSECRDGIVHTSFLHPSLFGLRTSTLADLRGGDASKNAGIIRAVLEGEGGPARDVVLLNAGAGLLVAGKAASVTDGMTQAAEAIDSGQTRSTLDAMIESSQEADA